MSEASQTNVYITSIARFVFRMVAVFRLLFTCRATKWAWQVILKSGRCGTRQYDGCPVAGSRNLEWPWS